MHLFYAACAAFRLARFNVQIDVVDKKYFIGLASPLAALLIACSVLVAAKYASLMTAIPTALTWFLLFGQLSVGF